MILFKSFLFYKRLYKSLVSKFEKKNIEKGFGSGLLDHVLPPQPINLITNWSREKIKVMRI
jgi:hypothetical protein